MNIAKEGSVQNTSLFDDEDLIQGSVPLTTSVDDVLPVEKKNPYIYCKRRFISTGEELERKTAIFPDEVLSRERKSVQSLLVLLRWCTLWEKCYTQSCLSGVSPVFKNGFKANIVYLHVAVVTYTSTASRTFQRIKIYTSLCLKYGTDCKSIKAELSSSTLQFN